MSVKLITAKCPECGSMLSIEENRKQAFCTYCGAKILISHDNEKVFRLIDEARIREDETDRIIRMRELDIEERENRSGKILFIAALIIALALIVSPLFFSRNIWASILSLLGIDVGMFAFIYNDKRKKSLEESRNKRSGKIKIQADLANVKGSNYKAVMQMFANSGFKNITAINLLDAGIRKKQDTVESVIINGENISRDHWYEPDASIVIRYHGKPNEN